MTPNICNGCVGRGTPGRISIALKCRTEVYVQITLFYATVSNLNLSPESEASRMVANLT